jgi:putative transposase
MPAATIPFSSLNGLLEKLDQDDRAGDALLSVAREHLKLLMEASLELDRTAQLGRGRSQRIPGAGYRNGYYERDLESGFGVIRHLRVPRLRQGRLEQQVFERYQRRQRDVERFIRALFFAGVSTRGVGEVLEILWGYAPSASCVSRIVAAIDKEVAAYHARPLGDGFLYLFLDGLTVTLKEAPSAKKRLVLVAYGLTHEGRRVLLDFRVAASESAEEWERFLLSLRRRGLLGANLRMVITDGGKGLRRAAADAYPDTPMQLCWAHKLRNVAGCLHRAHEKACLADARRIYQAANRREALHLWKEWQATWEGREPEAVACLGRDLEALLTFLKCPPEHRRIVRTTNYIERLIRELRRRTRPMGAFAHKASCERLFYGVIRRLNKRWSDRKPLPGFTQQT